MKKTNPDQFDEQWPLQEPREVKDDKNIRFPPLAQRQIVEDNLDPVVHWNYDPESNFIFISGEPRKKEPYEWVDRSAVDQPESDNTYIRAPERLPDNMLEPFKIPGTSVVYLASPEMLTDNNPSAWLLSWTQFTSFLPDVGSSADIGPAISRNPGFMPSSPF